MKNSTTKKIYRPSFQKGLSLKAVLFALLLPLTFALEGCIHAPAQAWTPTKRKNMKDAKPRSPKYEQRLHRVRAW